MSDPVTSYPVDYTGQAASNRIVDEQIVVLPPGDRLFHFTMPMFAPFYEDGHSLKMRDINNNVTPLTLGVDYYLSHKFMDASLATMHPIWGSVSFLKPLSGTLLMTYQTLGGVWTIDSATIASILMNTVQNPRITTWEQVVARPIDFPVVDHPWDLADMVGMSQILDVLNNFYTAYLTSLDPNSGGTGTSIILDHINNRNNPHQVTAAQAGAYSTLQIDTMLAGYLTTTGTAANSTLFNGKSYAQMLTDVTATKVSNAVHADTADNASNAGMATDSAALGGQSLTQVLQAAQAQTAANAAQFNGKTYDQAKADILTGQAADSAMLQGQTLQQIIATLQQSTGNATTLDGKTYDDIMAAVKTTKVDNATNADLATNSNALGGQSLTQVLASVAAVVPDLAHNSEAVYGYTFDQLITAILQSNTYSTQLDYLCVDLDVEHGTVITSNNGGTADANYHYLYVGDFPIPTTGPTNNFYDPTVEQVGSSFDMYLYYANQIQRIRVDVDVDANQVIGVSAYSDEGNLNGSVSIGTRNDPSTLLSSDGTKTGLFKEVWLKFKTANNLQRVGIYQFVKNSFVLDESETISLYDSTDVRLNTVSWGQPGLTANENLLQSNIDGEAATRAAADTAIRTDTQAAIDALADEINTLTATPAA